MERDKKLDELQITLLCIGVRLREENDLLRLEGVSLNLSTDTALECTEADRGDYKIHPGIGIAASATANRVYIAPETPAVCHRVRTERNPRVGWTASPRSVSTISRR